MMRTHVLSDPPPHRLSPVFAAQYKCPELLFVVNHLSAENSGLGLRTVYSSWKQSLEAFAESVSFDIRSDAGPADVVASAKQEAAASNASQGTGSWYLDAIHRNPVLYASAFNVGPTVLSPEAPALILVPELPSEALQPSSSAAAAATEPGLSFNIAIERIKSFIISHSSAGVGQSAAGGPDKPPPPPPSVTAWAARVSSQWDQIRKAQVIGDLNRLNNRCGVYD